MISTILAVPKAVPSCSEKSVADLQPLLVARLEDAGRVLLALPMKGHSTALRTGHPEVVHDAMEAYGWEDIQTRVPVPSAHRISQMEQALGWIRLLPEDQVRFRRIVGFRMLVHPLQDRHIYSWRQVGTKLGIHRDTAQRWHSDAIAAIAIRLLSVSFSAGQISQTNPIK